MKAKVNIPGAPNITNLLTSGLTTPLIQPGQTSSSKAAISQPVSRNIKIRNQNHKLYLRLLRKDIFFKNFNLNGSSNYGLHLILKKPNLNLIKRILNILDKNSIEYRLGSLGNQLRQPYLKKFKNSKYLKVLKNTEHMHFFSVYFGNNQFLRKNKIIKLCKDLDSLII